MSKYLKVSLAYIVKENTKFDKKTKLELLEFIRTASNNELQSIIKEKGEVEGKLTNSIIGIIIPLILSGGVLTLEWPTYRVIRAMFDKCTRRCGILRVNTGGRYACLLKCKIEGLTKLQSEVGKINCTKSKNPVKCNNSKKEKLVEIKNKLSKINKRYSEIRKELKEKKLKERKPAKSGDMKWI
jgi:hypothetical protein